MRSRTADLLIALGMRFDDRVTGKLDSYAQNAKKIHVDIDASEIHKNVRADVAIVGDLKQVLPKLIPLLTPQKRSAYWAEINDAKGAVAVRDIRNLPDTGHLYAAHVIHDLVARDQGQCADRDRRRPAPDVGGAVLPPQRSSLADHLGRTGHDGLRACRRRSAQSFRVPMRTSGSSSATAASR